VLVFVLLCPVEPEVDAAALDCYSTIWAAMSREKEVFGSNMNEDLECCTVTGQEASHYSFDRLSRSQHMDIRFLR
jgi:hypothetical protein